VQYLFEAFRQNPYHMPYHPRPISSLGPKGPLDDTAYDTDIHRFDNGMVEKINGCVRFAFQLSLFLKPGCQKKTFIFMLICFIDIFCNANAI
jgi:hypothetical protein